MRMVAGALVMDRRVAERSPRTGIATRGVRILRREIPPPRLAAPAVVLHSAGQAARCKWKNERALPLIEFPFGRCSTGGCAGRASCRTNPTAAESAVPAFGEGRPTKSRMARGNRSFAKVRRDSPPGSTDARSIGWSTRRSGPSQRTAKPRSIVFAIPREVLATEPAARDSGPSAAPLPTRTPPGFPHGLHASRRTPDVPGTISRSPPERPPSKARSMSGGPLLVRRNHRSPVVTILRPSPSP